MQIIFTKEDKKIARKTIDGFRQSYVIDAREMILEPDYIDGKLIESPFEFIVNKELERKLAQAVSNKKSNQIIYFHYNITSSLISNVKSFFSVRKAKVQFILHDPRQEMKSIWRMFAKVIKS